MPGSRTTTTNSTSTRKRASHPSTGRKPSDRRSDVTFGSSPNRPHQTSSLRSLPHRSGMMSSPRPDSIGGRLREARLAAGLSQSMLERKSGVPKSMLSRYENDHLLPSVRTLRRLAEAIELPASALFDDEGSPAMLDRELARRGIRFSSRAEMLRFADMISDAVRQNQTDASTARR